MADVGEAGGLPCAKEAPGLHAGFWRRAAAYVFDLVVVYIATVLLMAFLIVVPLTLAGHAPRRGDLWFMVVTWVILILIFWLYFAFFESSRMRGTPGKMALGLAVTCATGKRISFWRGTARTSLKMAFLSMGILWIGYLMAGWTARKQALHDGIANTFVVRKSGLSELVRVDSEAAGE